MNFMHKLENQNEINQQNYKVNSIKKDENLNNFFKKSMNNSENKTKKKTVENLNTSCFQKFIDNANKHLENVQKLKAKVNSVHEMVEKMQNSLSNTKLTVKESLSDEICGMNTKEMEINKNSTTSLIENLIMTNRKKTKINKSLGNKKPTKSKTNTKKFTLNKAQSFCAIEMSELDYNKKKVRTPKVQTSSELKSFKEQGKSIKLKSLKLQTSEILLPKVESVKSRSYTQSTKNVDQTKKYVSKFHQDSSLRKSYKPVVSKSNTSIKMKEKL